MLSWSLCCLWDPFPDGNYLGNNAGTPGHCYTFAVGNNVPSTYYGTARGTAGNAPLNAPGNAIGNNVVGSVGNTARRSAALIADGNAGNYATGNAAGNNYYAKNNNGGSTGYAWNDPT